MPLYQSPVYFSEQVADECKALNPKIVLMSGTHPLLGIGTTGYRQASRTARKNR